MRGLQIPAVIIRNLTDETHRALKLRAFRNGKSTEAEIRSILEAAAHPEMRVKIGSELAAFGRSLGGIELDIARDASPIEPADFE